MSYFSKYRHLYSQPERIDKYDPSAVRRRVERELERVRAIEGRRAALSPANQLHIQLLQDFVTQKSKAELDVQRAKERLKVTPSQSNLRDHKAAVSRLFNLAQRVERLRKVQSQRSAAQTAKPSGGDRRYFNFPSSPTALNPRTVYGTEAITRFISSESGLRPFFKLASLSLPCIQREVRREVMFAHRKAGKGHRTRHRLSPSSLVGC
jgi:hypothetical protein